MVTAAAGSRVSLARKREETEGVSGGVSAAVAVWGGGRGSAGRSSFGVSTRGRPVPCAAWQRGEKFLAFFATCDRAVNRFGRVLGRTGEWPLAANPRDALSCAYGFTARYV
eukprot:6558444-Prymnesium_polylepis.1